MQVQDPSVNIFITKILDFTLCFGIASFFTLNEGMQLNKKLYYKDSLVYLMSLALLSFFLRDNIINIYEALTLIILFPIYLIFSIIIVNKNENMNSQSMFQNELRSLNNIDDSLIITHSEHLK